MFKTAIIIPARFNSSRFPGKSLQLIDEYNVIQSVYLRAQKVQNSDMIVVATDDQRILRSIENIAGKAVLSAEIHDNGTSRIAEVAKDLKDYSYVINLQGDEPFVISDDIERIIKELKGSNCQIVTLMKECSSHDLVNSNVVKVKVDSKGNASAFERELKPNVLIDGSKKYKHIGIYGFKRNVLLDLVKLRPTFSEQKEKLEQLRWLDHGYDIRVIETKNESLGIDVPADLIKAKAFSKSLS